ncbi:MAG: hypothetical protein MJZ87_04825 [Bacteroidales bacterium]|nr:hypothetical protein [Bacteroidales bacterium]
MKKILIALCLILPLLVCCDIYQSPIPYVKLDFTIYPNDVSYYQLNTYGGYVYVTGGVNGIIIYRLDEWTFFAYDRACPHDFENQESWLWVAPDGLRMVDSLCGSTYNILDGSVLSGPSQYPARKYNTRYDGVRLRVYS